MKEFMLLFRQPSFDHSKLSKEEMQALTKKWQTWKESLESQNRLINNGTRLMQNNIKLGHPITSKIGH